MWLQSDPSPCGQTYTTWNISVTKRAVCLSSSIIVECDRTRSDTLWIPLTNIYVEFDSCHTKCLDSSLSTYYVSWLNTYLLNMYTLWSCRQLKNAVCKTMPGPDRTPNNCVARFTDTSCSWAGPSRRGCLRTIQQNKMHDTEEECHVKTDCTHIMLPQLRQQQPEPHLFLLLSL